MVTDPHKRTVYLMEHREFRGIWKWSRVPLKARRRMLRQLCRVYDVPVIPIISRTVPGQGGAYDYDRNRLEFDPEYGADVILFCHEVAHYFTAYRHGLRVQDHGPHVVVELRPCPIEPANYANRGVSRRVPALWLALDAENKAGV